MAVADLHYGYELRRRRAGCLTPDWGRSTLEARLFGLLLDHRPRCLILAGDVMDGSASASETLAFVNRLRAKVDQLVLLTGNHDRTGILHAAGFLDHHCETGFFFHHGHLPLPIDTLPPGTCVITGHHHPAHQIRDGAGLRLKLPALIREFIPGREIEQWVLPAFSPWSAGGDYRSPHLRLEVWVCSPGRVWTVPPSVD